MLDKVPKLWGLVLVSEKNPCCFIILRLGDFYSGLSCLQDNPKATGFPKGASMQAGTRFLSSNEHCSSTPWPKVLVALCFLPSYSPLWHMSPSACRIRSETSWTRRWHICPKGAVSSGTYTSSCSSSRVQYLAVAQLQMMRRCSLQ